MKKRSLLKLLSLTAIVSMVACSVSDKTLTSGQNRIDALKAQGMPDSLLSPAKLLIRQATDEKTRNPQIANKAADSLKVVLTQLEASFKSIVPQLQADIESMRAQISQVRSQLSGMQVTKVDSMMRKVDSLVDLKWYPDAAAKIMVIVSMLPQLKIDEQKSSEIKGKVTGTWTCTNVTKHSEDKTVNAVEKKIFILNSDGTCKFIEKKQGKSGPFLKEDYEFVSTGTYGFLGDTVYLSISRFSAVRQNFERLFIEGKNRTWKKDPQPTYDTTLTDKSQDRFIAYPDLVSDFVHSN
jgi:hypothetical protein